MNDSEVERRKFSPEESRQDIFVVSGARCASPEGCDKCVDTVEAEPIASEIERLYAEIESLRLRARQAEALNQIARTVNSNLDLESILSLVADEVQRLVPHIRASLTLAVEDKPQRLMVRPLKGRIAGEDDNEAYVSASGGGIGTAFVEGRPFIADDLRENLPFEFDKVLFEQGIRSYVCYPLRYGEQTIGTLNLGCDEPRGFRGHLALLEQIAEHLAIALRNSQRYEEERRRALEQAARRTVLAAASQKEGLREILDATLHKLIEATQTDAAWLLLRREEGVPPRLAAYAGLSRAFAKKEAQAAPACKYCSMSMQNKVSVLVDLAQDCPHLPHELIRSEGITKHLAVPVLDSERVVGVLHVASRSRQADLSARQQLFEAIGREIGPVVTQALLHERVRREQRKLSAVLNGTADLVLVLDYDLHILLLNEAAAQILNVSRDDVLGEPVTLLNLPRLDAALTASGGRSFVEEVPMPSGRTLQASASHVQDVGWVIVLRDVTSFKELDHLRTEWVASVSHDLKGPLATVQLSADLIEMAGPLNEKQRRKLQAVADAIERMRSLVTDVLELARLEAGPTFRNEIVYLNQVLKAVDEELRPLAEAKGQVLSLSTANELPPVSGDRQLLFRACANLVQNAIKYTPSQGWVRVSATVDGAMGVVSVADNGQGIPVGLQSRLFEPFFRGTQSTAQIEGTGLGLSIVKTIVEKHRGTIDVRSSPGVGSVFSFRIPVATDDIVQEHQTRQAPIKSAI